MKPFVCNRCGSNEFIDQGSRRTCLFCRTSYEKPPVAAIKASTIALDDDIGSLLSKCQADPANAKRYARLILELDPGNRKALTYL